MIKISRKTDIITKRHSLAHLLAATVLELYPKAKFAIGPAIENGFYYDFDLSAVASAKEDLPYSFNPNDLPKIEKKMQELIAKNIEFKKSELTNKKATDLFKKSKQTYKLSILKEEANSKKVTIYKTGDFADLCRGPHVASSNELDPKAFKLTSIAGAYWRGDEKNKMLQRIYGVAFDTKQELDTYLAMQAEAEKRDHRKLGRELELFIIDDNVGKGLPLWMPKGAIVRQTLERFIEDEETRRGYLRTYTPIIGNVRLYKMSGHWDHYRDNMYPVMKIENEEYVLRPMTCPHQFMIYKAKPHSYKELPLRYAELAQMYRKEKSGELSGLIRVMGFTLSDAHIICETHQLESEFLAVLDLVQYTLKSLGIAQNVSYRASLRDKANTKYINNDKLWNDSEKTLIKILKKAGLKYETAEGEAAFYGPKLDVQIKNIHGKEETIITVQIDLNSAEQFDLTYIDEKGNKKRPVIIHRSSIGCIERTIAFLIEYYGGAFPLWMAPVQALIMPVSDKHAEYAESIATSLRESGIRVELTAGNETLGKRIREGQMQKIPYLLVVGEKEILSKTVAVRHRDKGDLGTMPLNILVATLLDEIHKKI